MSADDNDISAQGAQKRQFVRVDDVLPISWRRCSTEEVADVIEYFEKHRAFPPRRDDPSAWLASLDVSSKLHSLERQDPLLAKVLGQLDTKLNLLLRLFNSEEESRPLVHTPVNVSGGGIGFLEVAPPLAAGDLLDMRIALSMEALTYIHCYVRVMRVFDKDENGYNLVACQYGPILDQDRETIIQYIFKRQAELLRRRRSLSS